MVNKDMVIWLTDRIKNNKINPVTSEPFKIEDIKIQEYKEAVQAELKTV